MKRPGPTSSDHPTADWSHNWDDIAAASRGHRPEVTWDSGAAHVITAFAGHRPDGPSYRDVPADGYTQSPGQ